MDDEWDLHAVVRSCTTTSANSAASTTAGVDDDNHFSNFGSLSFGNEDNQFLYPGFMDNPSYRSEGLEEIYRESYSQPPLITTGAQNTTAALAATSIPVQGEGSYDMLQDSHTFSIQDMNSQSVQYRKRKNQQKKMVRQMTQEELSNDLWAWRKYGQKPIKGSPYPRNYYRCSTSKGCVARKQVERSPMDSTIFIVSYSGEHTHPRPTHRSSLAGSTRIKISTVDNKIPISLNTSSSTTVPNNPPTCSSSSPASASSFSPPLMEEESDDDILIPNITMTEEILKDFQELNTTGRGGLLSPPPPPWSPTSSVTAFGRFSGGGDC